MHGGYRVAPMTPETSDAAFLLVGALTPRLSPALWRTYGGFPQARPGESEGRHAVRIATNPRGHVQGLCLWGPARHAVHGLILDVPVFIVASAADGPGVAAALVSDLCAIAVRHDCSAVRIRSETSPRSLAPVQAARRDGRGMALILDTSPFLDVPWGASQEDTLPVKA